MQRSASANCKRTYPTALPNKRRRNNDGGARSSSGARPAGAFDRFGRAREHPAKLNFGDYMAYAVSAVMRAPLLFKGGDFGLTDVMAHPASIGM
jgi:hypothetical protein